MYISFVCEYHFASPRHTIVPDGGHDWHLLRLRDDDESADAHHLRHVAGSPQRDEHGGICEGRTGRRGQLLLPTLPLVRALRSAVDSFQK